MKNDYEYGSICTGYGNCTYSRDYAGGCNSN
jgi:hypothetical protein